LRGGTLDWLFDLIFLTGYESHSNGDFDERKQYYQHGEVNNTQFSESKYSNYMCETLPFEFDESIMRLCSYVTSTCASDWADSEVEAMCLAYTDYYCHGTDYFRNPHCALCKHVDLFETEICITDQYKNTKKKFMGFAKILYLNELQDITPDPDNQNTTMTNETNDGKLMFSYECACILHAKEKRLRE
jgi:hypothetical protein